MLQPIIVAIDFSDCGRRAMDEATRLASSMNVPLIIVHAYPPARYAPVLMGHHGEQVAAAQHASQVRDEAIQLTGVWAEGARGQGLVVDVVADEGPAAPLILATAENRGASLIVMGTHGRRGAAKLLLGSVAEAVLRKSDRPVVIVPPERKPA